RTRTAEPVRQAEPAAESPLTRSKPARGPIARAEHARAKPAPARREPPVAARANPAHAAIRQPEPETSVVSDHPITFVPVPVQTEVRLARRREAPAPAPAPAPADADTASEQDWPLLCGQVVDETGTPLEGARVLLASPSLVVRTDRRGRFCIACPA